MRRQLFFTAALALAASGTAVADMGPPPGFSRVPRDLVLEVASEFPGYRFWLVSHYKVEPLDLAPAHPFRVDGEGRNGSHRLAHVVAAPVGMVEDMGEGQFHEAFFAGKLPQSVLRSDEIDFYARVPFYDSRERLTDRIRVEFAPGQPVRLVWLGQNEGSPWVKRAWVAAGFFAFAAVACGALWLRRKLAREKALT